MTILSPSISGKLLGNARKPRPEPQVLRHHLQAVPPRCAHWPEGISLFNPSPWNAACAANCVGTFRPRSSSGDPTNSSLASSGPEAGEVRPGREYSASPCLSSVITDSVQLARMTLERVV
jgi:hypothetical protein